MLLALREIVERQPALALQIGVNAGHVFAGDIGTTFRRNYTVMGDAVNLAARVMARAQPGQLLATASVLDSSRTLFETDALEPFFVKGKRRPVTAFSVGPARGVRAEVAGAELPLVGRDDDLARVVPVIDGLTSGRGGVIEIVGDPGAGKSRFFSEIERRAAGIPVRTAQCRLYQAATPYFPIGQLLEGIIGVPGGSAEAATRLEQVVSVAAPQLRTWLPLIGIPLGLELAETEEVAQLDEAFRKQRLEEAVIELFAALLNEPTILCFEDTHWMDDSSADLVRALAAGRFTSAVARGPDPASSGDRFRARPVRRRPPGRARAARPGRDRTARLGRDDVGSVAATRGRRTGRPGRRQPVVPPGAAQRTARRRRHLVIAEHHRGLDLGTRRPPRGRGPGAAATRRSARRRLPLRVPRCGRRR